MTQKEACKGLNERKNKAEASPFLPALGAAV